MYPHHDLPKLLPVCAGISVRNCPPTTDSVAPPIPIAECGLAFHADTVRVQRKGKRQMPQAARTHDAVHLRWRFEGETEHEPTARARGPCARVSRLLLCCVCASSTVSCVSACHCASVAPSALQCQCARQRQAQTWLHASRIAVGCRHFCSLRFSFMYRLFYNLGVCIGQLVLVLRWVVMEIARCQAEPKAGKKPAAALATPAAALTHPSQ